MVSKFEFSIILFATSLYILQVIDSTIHVQEVLDIIHDFNEDEKLIFAQMLPVENCHRTESSIACSDCGNNQFP